MDIEYGSIENLIRLDAPPLMVYEVVRSPEHVTVWWFDEADFEPTPGSAVWTELRDNLPPYVANLAAAGA